MSDKQAVTRRPAADEWQMSGNGASQVEAREQRASAEAKAGINLNIFAALSGSMSQRKTKSTNTATDGSSRTVEQTDTVARAKGLGHGNLSAYGTARSEGQDRAIGPKSTKALTEDGKDHKRTLKGKEETEARPASKPVDHLGIGHWEE